METFIFASYISIAVFILASIVIILAVDNESKMHDVAYLTIINSLSLAVILFVIYIIYRAIELINVLLI